MENKIIVKQKHMWKIKNFTQETVNKYGERQYVKSEEFEIAFGDKEIKTKWHFKLYPRFNKECLLMIYNAAADREKVVPKVINVMIPKSDGTTFHIKNELSVVGQVAWLCYGQTTDDILNEYLLNNVLTFIINLEFHQELTPAKKRRRSSPVPNWIANYFDSKVLSDISIICSDEKSIPAHRNILAGRSSVFEKMLTTEMAEKKSNRIEVEDIDGDTMLELLRYIYRQEVENIETHAPKLLYCADKYDIPGLKLICADRFIKQLSDDNIFENIQRAKMFNEKNLMNACMEYIDTNFQKLKKSEEWKKLDQHLMVEIMDNMQHSFKRTIIFLNSL